MKKILFLIAILSAITANAQNYYISFAGTGAASTVDSVKVENLMTGTSLILKGDDILHLTGTVGIPSYEYDKPAKLKIYPNPMKDYSMIEISPSVAGEAIITVFDMAGRQLSQTQNYLDKSKQEFRLSGLKDGFYLINVRSNNYQYSGKLLCTGQSDGTLNIEKVSNNIEAIDEKTSKMEKKGSRDYCVMPMLDGDRLLYTGYSGSYGTVTTDIPTQDGTVTFTFIPCSDGTKYYLTVQIGTQIWMANNLSTSALNDGSRMIPGPNVPDPTPAYCYYDASPEAYGGYGTLYNWFAVNTGKLCPTGWHVPADYEWGELIRYLGSDILIRGGKLKETGPTHWIYPNYAATDEVGFTALPGGCYRDGHYVSLGTGAYWWTADPVPGGSFSDYYNLYNDTEIGRAHV
jgi:uncharacterized protein (TIGR02145 family)